MTQIVCMTIAFVCAIASGVLMNSIAKDDKISTMIKGFIVMFLFYIATTCVTYPIDSKSKNNMLKQAIFHRENFGIIINSKVEDGHLIKDTLIYKKR